MGRRTLLVGGLIAGLALGCSDGSSDSDAATSPSEDAADDGAVPFEVIPMATPSAIAPDSPWRAVSIDIESAPRSVVPGAVLEFVVALTNTSPEAIDPGRDCPAYFMNFGESSEAAGPVTSLLNCDAAGRFPAGATERFAMEIPLPHDLDLDHGAIYWRLEGVADASSDEIAVLAAGS